MVSPCRVYIRKAQYQFGWDFCPALAGCGIWQPVRLEGIKTARFEDVHIRTIDCNELYADIRIAVKLDKIKNESLRCNLLAVVCPHLHFPRKNNRGLHFRTGPGLMLS